MKKFSTSILKKTKRFPFHFKFNTSTLKKESKRLLKSNPNCIPLIANTDVWSYKHGLELKENKFLIHKDFTVGYVHSVIRMKNNIKPWQSFVILFDGKIYSTMTEMNYIFNRKERDFLFCYLYLLKPF